MILSDRDIETIAYAAEIQCPVAVYSSRMVRNHKRTMPPARNMTANVEHIKRYVAKLTDHGSIDIHVSLDTCG